MAWGGLVQNDRIEMFLDQDYANLAFRREGSRQLSNGYYEINIDAQGIRSLVLAARHPGLSVALIGYIRSGDRITGIRVYARGSGRFYWRAYEDAWEIKGGWGMEIRNGKGRQVFHSDHRYADVANSQYYLDGNRRGIGDRYYLMNTPAVPRFDYATAYDTSVQADYQRQQTGTRRTQKTRQVYRCTYQSVYVNGRFTRQRVCNWVRETYYEDVPVYGMVIVGYWVNTLVTVSCNKTLSLVRHDGSSIERIDYVVEKGAAWSTYYSEYNRSGPRGTLTIPRDYAAAMTQVAKVTKNWQIKGHKNRLIQLY